MLRNEKCHFPIGPSFHIFEFVTTNFSSDTTKVNIFSVCFLLTRYVVFQPNLSAAAQHLTF